MMNLDQIRHLQEFLFSSDEEMDKAGINSHTKKRLLRLRAVYTYWLSDPKRGDKDIVSVIKRDYGMSPTVAYDDVRLLKILIGNLNQATDEWYRWVFNQRCEEGFALARKNNDANAYARMLAAYVKGSRLDHEKSDRPDYSLIVPQTFEITSNASDAGFKALPDLDKRIDAMKKKYMLEYSEFEEVPVEAKPLKPEKAYAHNTSHQ